MSSVKLVCERAKEELEKMHKNTKDIENSSPDLASAELLYMFLSKKLDILPLPSAP